MTRLKRMLQRFERGVGRSMAFPATWRDWVVRIGSAVPLVLTMQFLFLRDLDTTMAAALGVGCVAAMLAVTYVGQGWIERHEPE